jgi:hypothetical protein
MVMTLSRNVGSSFGRVLRVGWVVPLALVIAIVAVSCGSSDGDGDGGFAKIDPNPVILDLSSFDDARLKLAKEYDVSELPDAAAAYLGYFTPPNSEPIQYELRMYPDHASAIANGVTYAEEVTGEDALLRSADVRWEEGTKDRRGGGAFRGQLTPLYGDFAVVGNVIMLCEGRSSEQSLERCAALLAAVGIGAGG